MILLLLFVAVLAFLAAREHWIAFTAFACLAATSLGIVIGRRLEGLRFAVALTQVKVICANTRRITAAVKALPGIEEETLALARRLDETTLELEKTL